MSEKYSIVCVYHILFICSSTDGRIGCFHFFFSWCFHHTEFWTQCVLQFGKLVLSCFSHVWLFVIPWTVAHQAPLSIDFQDWKRSIFIPTPKKGNVKEHSNYHTITLILHVSKVILKILQARPQQYMNWELLGIKRGLEVRGIRDQIANICWIIEKAG